MENQMNPQVENPQATQVQVETQQAGNLFPAHEGQAPRSYQVEPQNSLEKKLSNQSQYQIEKENLRQEEERKSEVNKLAEVKMKTTVIMEKFSGEGYSEPLRNTINSYKKQINELGASVNETFLNRLTEEVIGGLKDENKEALGMAGYLNIKHDNIEKLELDIKNANIILASKQKEEINNSLGRGVPDQDEVAKHLSGFDLGDNSYLKKLHKLA